jgi:beta-glucanase (GH16 family)
MIKFRTCKWHIAIIVGLALAIGCSKSKKASLVPEAITTDIKATVTLPEGYGLVWRDEFDGTALDLNKWAHTYVGARGVGYNTPNAVTVGNGIVRIHTYTDNGKHYTGFISTKGGRYKTTYGFFEARINYHGAPGNHGAFWLQSPTIGNPIGDTQTAGTEIDVTEHRLQDNSGKIIDNVSNSALHWDGYGADHKSVGNLYKSTVSLNNSWHTYAVLWSPDLYIFYVDGKESWRTSSAPSKALEELRLTCEITDMLWSGTPPVSGYGSLSESPYGMEVDWVRVWQKK